MNQRVFLDASFWIVYRDEKGDGHASAKQTVERLFQQRTHFVTTLPVICEIHAYFCRSLVKRERALKDFWNNPVVTIEEISHQDQIAAIELLQQHRDKTFSLCDAVSFVVMRRLNLSRVLARDNHFRQTGEFQIVDSR
jgi:predicted nucleic acid-binding protein